MSARFAARAPPRSALRVRRSVRCRHQARVHRRGRGRHKRAHAAITPTMRAEREPGDPPAGGARICPASPDARIADAPLARSRRGIHRLRVIAACVARARERVAGDRSRVSVRNASSSTRHLSSSATARARTCEPSSRSKIFPHVRRQHPHLAVVFLDVRSLIGALRRSARRPAKAESQDASPRVTSPEGEALPPRVRLHACTPARPPPPAVRWTSTQNRHTRARFEQQQGCPTRSPRQAAAFFLYVPSGSAGRPRPQRPTAMFTPSLSPRTTRSRATLAALRKTGFTGVGTEVDFTYGETRPAAAT